MSLVDTRVQNMRAKSNIDKNTLRTSRYGGLDTFVQQSDDPAGILTQELKDKARTSIGSVLETPVFDFDSGISIGNARSVTIADSVNTSHMLTITFATYTFGFTIVPSLYMNNEISMQADFERSLKKYINLLGETLDLAAIASLEANKTQIFGDLLDYTQTSNAVQIPWKKRFEAMGDVNSLMSANDFYGMLDIVGSAGSESLIRKLMESGAQNAIDKTLQYSDKDLHVTNRITREAGEFANFYAIEKGSLGFLARFEREALLNTRMADGTEWGISMLPYLDIPVGTYYYESKGDFSAIAGAASADMDRVRKQHYGFAVDVAFLTSYNQDLTTYANPIMKFTMLDETVSDALQVNVVNTTTDPVYTQEVV